MGYYYDKKGTKAYKPKPKYTKTDLYRMSKEEQIRLLKSLGVTKIPRTEGGRVKEILKRS